MVVVMMVVSTDLSTSAYVRSYPRVGLYQRGMVLGRQAHSHAESTGVRGVSYVMQEDDQTSPVLEN